MFHWTYQRPKPRYLKYDKEEILLFTLSRFHFFLQSFYLFLKSPIFPVTASVVVITSLQNAKNKNKIPFRIPVYSIPPTKQEDFIVYDKMLCEDLYSSVKVIHCPKYTGICPKSWEYLSKPGKFSGTSLGVMCWKCFATKQKWVMPFTRQSIQEGDVCHVFLLLKWKQLWSSMENVQVCFLWNCCEPEFVNNEPLPPREPTGLGPRASLITILFININLMPSQKLLATHDCSALEMCLVWLRNWILNCITI